MDELELHGMRILKIPCSDQMYERLMKGEKVSHIQLKYADGEGLHDLKLTLDAPKWPDDPEITVQYAACALLRAGSPAEDIVESVQAALEWERDEMNAEANLAAEVPDA